MDWTAIKFILAVLAIVVGLVFAILVPVSRIEAAQREEFMRQCLVERPEYECVAMWRSGNVPLPIIMPVVM